MGLLAAGGLSDDVDSQQQVSGTSQVEEIQPHVQRNCGMLLQFDDARGTSSPLNQDFSDALVDWSATGGLCAGSYSQHLVVRNKEIHCVILNFLVKLLDRVVRRQCHEHGVDAENLALNNCQKWMRQRVVIARLTLGSGRPVV